MAIPKCRGQFPPVTLCCVTDMYKSLEGVQDDKELENKCVVNAVTNMEYMLCFGSEGEKSPIGLKYSVQS